MTKEQKARLNTLIEQYKFCFIIRGYLHAKYNEKRMEIFLTQKKPLQYEFIRITADITYVFWNPRHNETIY